MLTWRDYVFDFVSATGLWKCLFGPLPAEVFPSPVKLTELTITRTGPGMTVTFVQLTVATQDKYAMILFLL